MVDWLRARLPAGAPLVLAGFSFGAYVSLGAAVQAHPAAQVSISINRPLCGQRLRSRTAPLPMPRLSPGWQVHSSTDDEVVELRATPVPPCRPIGPPAAGHALRAPGISITAALPNWQDAVLPFLQERLPA